MWLQRTHTAFLPLSASLVHASIHSRVCLIAGHSLAQQQQQYATLANVKTPRSGPTSSNNFPSSTATPVRSASIRAGQISSHFSTTSKSHEQATMTTTLPSRGGFESKAPSVFTTRKVGAPHTLEHRIYIEKDGVPVSPFHDVPLYANEQQTVLNMVVEIPRWTNAKQEVSNESLSMDND